MHIEAAHMKKPTLNAICHKQSEKWKAFVAENSTGTPR